MALDHIIKHSCRFNIKNPQHKKVNEVLVNLNPEVCKSKSQFLIDAAEYYIDHFGKEAFVERLTDDSPYVTKSELQNIEDKMLTKAIMTAKDEVIRLLGGTLAGVAATKQIVVQSEPVQTEESKEEYDEVISDYALSCMGMEE